MIQLNCTEYAEQERSTYFEQYLPRLSAEELSSEFSKNSYTGVVQDNKSSRDKATLGQAEIFKRMEG